MRFPNIGIQTGWRMAGWMGVALCMAWSLINVSVAANSLALTHIVRQTMAVYFGGNTAPGQARKPVSYQAYIHSLPVSANQAKPTGLFVTLSKNGKSRACWGSIYPSHKNQVEATVYATLGALTKEYRYKPITPSEWKSLKPQVTVIKAIEPIDGLQGVNPMRDGLMVRTAGKSGVLLPGEARDAVYALVQCRLKAGVKPGESYQMYRIVADVYQ